MFGLTHTYICHIHERICEQVQQKKINNFAPHLWKQSILIFMCVCVWECNFYNAFNGSWQQQTHTDSLQSTNCEQKLWFKTFMINRCGQSYGGEKHFSKQIYKNLLINKKNIKTKKKKTRNWNMENANIKVLWLKFIWGAQKALQSMRKIEQRLCGWM